MATACGGGDDEPAGDIDVTTTRGSSGTSAPQTTQAGSSSSEEPETIEFTVGEEVWHSGFRIEVVGGSVVPEERGFSSDVVYTLTLELSVENLGNDAAFFGPAATITANTGVYTWDSGFSLAGDIPGGLSGPSEIVLRVEEGFDPSSATIIFGNADENRAIAPLGPGGDAAVRLEPATVEVSGEANMELVDLVFEGGSLTYDNVPRHRQIEAGKRALTLDFSVVSRNQGNWSIFDTNFALELPDGTSVPPDGSQLDNIAGSANGVTTDGQFVRFLVDEDASGTYALTFTPGSWFVGDDEIEEATFEFTLP